MMSVGGKDRERRGRTIEGESKNKERKNGEM